MAIRALRHITLPARGTLLVSTDMHGNGGDFRALSAIFAKSIAQDPDAHWAILGDCVHGPSPEARKSSPEMYDYDDESFAIVLGTLDLMRRYPGRIHYVLGNHDFGHIGGPRTSKFYPDEVAHLEGTLTENERGRLRQLFSSALLGISTPCGAFLAHGSPDDTLLRASDLNDIAFPPETATDYGQRVLSAFLTCYGQRGDITDRFLTNISRGGNKLSFVIHGHDRDEHGFFIEGGNQLCPVIFGATRENKRYVRLHLSANYISANDLQDGEEILRLYG